MEYYCLMVRTGAESDFKERATKALADQGVDATLHFFQRRLRKVMH